MDSLIDVMTNNRKIPYKFYDSRAWNNITPDILLGCNSCCNLNWMNENYEKTHYGQHSIDNSCSHEMFYFHKIS